MNTTILTRRSFLSTLGIGAGAALLLPRTAVAAGGAPRAFLAGADISMLDKIEEKGGVFREAGKPRDFLALMKDRGCTMFRLRLFVNPDHRNAVVNDLEYTLGLAARIKAADLKLLLNFHYSDTWADPGHQTKPAAWRDLDFEALEHRVEEYTASVITAFKKKGILPDMVQPGNEITPGMLWPDGKLGGKGDRKKQWRRFGSLLKAAIRGARKPLPASDTMRMMIHIDRGGDRRATRWFFENLRTHGIEYDVIGLSYYPWWHGSLADLRENLHSTARTFGKDIIVVETAYPHTGERRWREKKNMDWPVSPEGQRAFLHDVIATVQQTPESRGIGVLWWYPESIPVPGLRIWNGGATALFDAKGNVLPAATAFRATQSLR